MSILRAYALEELGTGGYPNAWTKGDPTIKHLVREEAGHRCVRCSHPYRNGYHGRGEWSPCDDRCHHDGPFKTEDIWDQGNPVVGIPAEIIDTQVFAQWRILTVHHLDGDKLNCRWWNLAALCQRCHLTIQGKVKMHQTYPWEHSEWFRPYAAGYYAFTYLGEDLTRLQTVLRIDELLALERVS